MKITSMWPLWLCPICKRRCRGMGVWFFRDSGEQDTGNENFSRKTVSFHAACLNKLCGDPTEDTHHPAEEVQLLREQLA